VTRLGLGFILVLPPLLVACGSGKNAGPGSGGADAGIDATGAGGGSGAGGNAGGGAGGSAAGTTGAGGMSGDGGSPAGSGGASGGGGAAGATAGGGAGGTTGAGGAAGSAGGRGGSGGAGGGSAGRGGGGPGGTGGMTGSDLRLEYMNSSSTATSFSVRITNAGPSTPLISAIKIRYYFRDDTTNRQATPMVLDATWRIASTSGTIDLRMTPGCAIVATFATAPQSSYVDADCPMPSPLNAQDTITMTIAIDPPAQIASNDYSYANTAGAFVPNDRMLVLLNGVVVAGTPP
jgi:hypothetical protein